jgi:hypothetical protein
MATFALCLVKPAQSAISSSFADPFGRSALAAARARTSWRAELATFAFDPAIECLRSLAMIVPVAKSGG